MADQAHLLLALAWQSRSFSKFFRARKGNCLLGPQKLWPGWIRSDLVLRMSPSSEICAGLSYLPEPHFSLSVKWG